MTVIVEVRMDGGAFELGRILRPPDGTELVVDRLVREPAGTVPVWADGPNAGAVPDVSGDRSAVDEIRFVERFDDRCLYVLEWDPGTDDLVGALRRSDGRLLEGRVDEDWTLQLRFPGAGSLREFVDHCRTRDVAVDVTRRFAPDVDSTAVDGLTDRQRTTISLAVRSGYYDIPRRTTTKELGDRLGVSDQAVTERLRRAIGTLVDGTLHADRED